MRYRFLMSGLALAGVGLSAAGAQPVPDIGIIHLGVLEREGCGGAGQPDPKVVTEVSTRLPEFRAAWAAMGPRLMAATAETSGQPYLFREAQAVLHACDNFGSVSSPLMIVAGRYTAAWAALPGEGGAARRQRPMAHFVNNLWHEATHRHIRETLERMPGGTTPLREKYAAEPPFVRNHIHLFALERLVWDRLGMKAEQDERVARVLEGGYPENRRAYEIVRTEGAEKLVAELRAAPSPPPPPIVAEARAFMEGYAKDLRAGNRVAIAARYDRRGSYRMGKGEKHLDKWTAIRDFYAGPEWTPPVSFEWRDLSYEPAGPDSVVVAGTFLWGAKGLPAPVAVSYTGLLTRQDGELRIRLEDEDAKPPKK